MGDPDSEPGRQGESVADAAPGLSDDRLYRGLASTRRRRLVSYLLAEGESTVQETATVLVGWDASQGGTMATPEDREKAVTSLLHVHLPLLDDTGLVAYDRENGTVAPVSLPPAVRDLIRESVAADPSAHS